MGFKPVKRGMSEFEMDCHYDEMVEEFAVMGARRVRGFVEAEQNGHKTWIVDFQLSGGAFYGWSLWDMSADFNGVSTLKWILDKDFPQEIKDTILKHFEERGYDDDNGNTPKAPQQESYNEFLNDFDSFFNSGSVRSFEVGGRKNGRRASFNKSAGKTSWL